MLLLSPRIYFLIFDTMGIDTTEVIDAAATKWNFIKLTPGLVGGHCIGVDPYYLTHKAQELGYKPNLILGARQINNGMSKYIAERTIKEMITHDKKIKSANVLVLGLTFKEDCPDIRNSKVFDIIYQILEKQIVVIAVMDLHKNRIIGKKDDVFIVYPIKTLTTFQNYAKVLNA